MKKALLLIIIFQSAFCVTFGQRIKYKDLVPMLDSASIDQALPMLTELLQTERDNPNANYRLGILYSKKYKSTDPLRKFEVAMEYANRTKLQMVKSKALIDNREVSRNDEWYLGAVPGDQGTRIDFPIVQQSMDNEYNLAETFLTSTPPAYNSFTNAVSNYDKAKKLYATIAERYASIKELYLLYDESVERELMELQSLYDSTHYYFDAYKRLLVNTTINYDQQLAIKPIDVYRKDGLAIQTDFFNPRIEIWNYKEWAAKVINEVRLNIASLRRSLQANYEKISARVDEISSGNTEANFVTIDKQLMFNLGRLDFQNALIPMLQYNQFKQEYLSRKNELSGLDSDSTITIQTKLQLYTLLLYESIQADSILADLIAKSQDDEKLQRHGDFINDNFGNVDSFRKMSLDEKQKVGVEYNNYVKLIKNAVQVLSKEDSTLRNSFSHQRMTFPLYVDASAADSLIMNTPVTTHIEMNPDGSTYLAGSVIRNAKSKHAEAFVGKVDSKDKVLWMKYFDLQVDEKKSLANHFPTAIRATQKGVLAAISSEMIDSAHNVNNLVYLSDTGDELLSVKVDKEPEAQFINYQENTRSFIITYYEPDAVDGSLHIMNVTDTGSVVWEKQMVFAGRLNEVLNVHEGVLLAGTATHWKSEKSELRKPQPTLFVAKVGLDGEIASERMVDGFRLDKAYKVNDSNISLMSSLSAAELPPGSTDFIITNSSLELIYPRKE